MADGETRLSGRKELSSLWIWTALAVMILLQLCVLAYWGSQKQGYHVDEIFSYQNCNGYYQRKFYNTPGFSNAWHDRDYYLGSLYAHADQRFSYGTVAANVKSDSSAHPPLYHLALHTVLSLFPETFSKWLGIVPNMLFFIVSQCFLFLIAAWFLGKESKWLALLPCLIWGFSAGAVSMVLFIRMYGMLIMWILGLVYCHLRLISDRKQAKWLILTGCFAFLSFMTHYYSVIFIFFLAACHTLFRLIRHGWKAALAYAASILGALGSMVICWPASITRGIIGSNRGTQAVSNLTAVSFSSFADHFLSFLSMISEALFNTWMKELALVFALLLLFLWIKKRFHPTLETDGKTGMRVLQITLVRRERYSLVLSDALFASLFLAVSGLAIFVILAAIAPYQELRYVSFLLPLTVLCVFFLLKRLAGCFFKHPAVFPIVTAVLFAIITLFSYRGGNVLFLYPTQARYSALIAQSGCDTAVCFYNQKWETASNGIQFLDFSRVYCTDIKKIDTLPEILDGVDYSGGVIIYVDKGADQNSAVHTILESTDFGAYKELFTDKYYNAYYFSI